MPNEIWNHISRKDAIKKYKKLNNNILAIDMKKELLDRKFMIYINKGRW